MRRRPFILAGILLTAVVAAVGGIFFSIKSTIDSRSGSVHRFPVPAGETFLTDDRAAAIAREVMNRDGFPESAWKLMTNDRTKALDGRPDRFLARNTINSNQGYVYFHCDDSPTPQRFVNIELRDGEITAQGTLGK